MNMKGTLATIVAMLAIGGCTEDGPGAVSAVPEPEPGDPAVYAPDGWPLQIGDRISDEEWRQLRNEYQLPVEPRAEPLNPAAHAGHPWKSPWRGHVMNLVGGRVYAARIDYDPTELGDYDNVYRGHFRIRFKEYMRHYEPDLPPEFHGKVEYYVPLPPPSPDPNKSLVLVFDPDELDATGRRMKPNLDWIPDPAAGRYERLKWPNYPERLK